MDKAKLKELREHGKCFISPVGSSMKPLFKSGQCIVEIRPVHGDPAPMDVVLYDAGDVGVLHRFIRMEGDICIILGDNCVTCERVHRDRIVGRMVSFYRGGKWYKVTYMPYIIYSVIWTYLRDVRIFAKRCFGFVKRNVKKITGK
ncbi:MAG: S24/S26 family peptidase [Oscillospiraceae bacterium]|nr:S24/S26 family peptidase [Oscillospiraceae bacterium]